MSSPRLRTLLSFWIFIICVSIHSGAQARTVGPSTPASMAASRALTSTAAESLQYCQDDANALPVSELNALEPEATEQDAGPEKPALDGLTLCLVPVLPFLRETVRPAPVAYTAQGSVSSALARGPPHIGG